MANLMFGLLILWLVLVLLCFLGFIVEVIDNHQRKLRLQKEIEEEMLVVISDPLTDLNEM